ncbi:MAG: NAD(P)/FAD-dependent oxidoreductase [Jiangellaceae bacterium]|nr:NAD(P)/FAD-dependent oxidoreductase [Jiangellaceae bacterium]
MTADVDVLVAGGGPVGLAAAIEARLAGLSVLVYEPRTTPLDKACGEGLMPGAVRALARLGVRPAGREFYGIRYVDSAAAVEHRFRSGPGLGVRRTALHAALSARAAELGVRVESRRVDAVRADATGVSVSAGGVQGRWLLGCDGLHSLVRRDLGLAGPGVPVVRYGVRRHYRLQPWSDVVEVHWSPAGEAYVTPVGDELVGVAVLGARGLDYAEVVSAAPQLRDRLRGAPVGSELRGAGPLWQTTSRRTRGRALLVGDAAGYVDALTGEGIRLGLAQARAAVAAIVRDDPAAYERDWRRLSRYYRLLTTMLVGAATRPALRRRIVPVAARLPGLYGALVERLAQ